MGNYPPEVMVCISPYNKVYLGWGFLSGFLTQIWSFQQSSMANGKTRAVALAQSLS